MKKRDYTHLKKYSFKPKYTKEDLALIRKMKEAGQSRGDIFYVMMQRRPDVAPITIGRWIDRVISTHNETKDL